VTSLQVTTTAFRATGCLPVYRRAARDLRMASGPSSRIIGSVRMAFRGTRRIIQNRQNAARIAFGAGRMAR
jgi:hypothetical protein